MNNQRIVLTILFFLIIIFTMSDIISAHENETKITTQESRITAPTNVTFSESPLKSDGMKDYTTIYTAIILLLLGWILGVLQPFIIEPLKKLFDKRKFKKIIKKDIKNIINHLKSKEQSILDFLGDNTLDNAIQRLADPAEDVPLMIAPTKISTDFYLKNYVKILEYFDDENLINFYLRIQTLNSLTDIIKEHKIRNNSYRILILSYFTNLGVALREGENLSS